jgi:hypothetical protein
MRISVVLLAVALSCIGLAARAQDTAQNKAAALASLGTDAAHVIASHYTIDASVKTPKTGKSLSSKGKWSAGEQQPADCPQTQDTCIRLFYQVPEADVDCEWTVVLLGDATSGTVLSENDDAARYFLAQLNHSDAMALVVTRKDPMRRSKMESSELRVTVGANGEVEQVQILRGPHEFTGLAVDAMKQWRFNSFLIGTRKVRFQTDFTM